MLSRFVFSFIVIIIICSKSADTCCTGIPTNFSNISRLDNDNQTSSVMNKTWNGAPLQPIIDEENEWANEFDEAHNVTKFDEMTTFLKSETRRNETLINAETVKNETLFTSKTVKNGTSIKLEKDRNGTFTNIEKGKPPKRQPQQYKVEQFCKIVFPKRPNCTCATIAAKLPTFKCKNTSSESTPKRKCNVLPITRTRASLTIVIAAFGAFGNALVLLVRFPPYRHSSAQQRKNRRSVHQRLIAGLALSDLIFACLFMVTYAPETFLCWWPYGNVFCKISKSLLMTSFALDITLIFVIAVERYYGIVYSHRGPWSQAKCNVVVWPLVLVCVALSAPLFFVYDLSRSQHCIEDWARVSAHNGSLIYSWISFLCFFLLPVVTVTVLHVRSLMWLHRTVFGHLMENLDDVTRLRFVKDNRRILTIMITILVSFALLVGPSHVVWLYYDYYGLNRVSFETRLVLRLFCETTYAFHVAANPVIYSLVDTSFRKELVGLLCNRGPRERNQSGGNSYQLHLEDHSRTVASCSI